MLRGNRRFVFTALGCVIAAVLLWLLFLPREPNLPFDGDPEAETADYQAGGPNCRPAILMRLHGKAAASERERCAEAAEQHRLQSNDLIQQTRAADAAQESAWMAYESTRISLAGLLGGFLTVVAAGFAAYYARRAYLETKRTADLAKQSLEIETRPFLYLEDIEWEEMTDEITGELHFAFTALIRNVGHLPATNVRLWSGVAVVKVAEMAGYTHTFEEEAMIAPHCPSGVVRRFYFGLTLTKEEVEDFEGLRSAIGFGFRVEFDTRFVSNKTIEEFRWGDAYVMREKKRLYINPPTFLAELEDDGLFGSEAKGGDDANHDTHRG